MQATLSSAKMFELQASSFIQTKPRLTKCTGSDGEADLIVQQLYQLTWKQKRRVRK